MTQPNNSYMKGSDRFYRWNGRSYVSVTTIIDRLPKVKLQEWKDRRLIEDYRSQEETLREMKPSEVLSYLRKNDWSSSAETGSTVHRYLESLAKGWELPPPDNDELRGFYEQCHRFIDEYRPEFIESEFTVYSDEWGYAGTGDEIIEIRGERFICDTKTGKRIYPEVALQMSAYRNADFIGRADGRNDPIPDCSRKNGLVLHIRPDRYELRSVRIGTPVHQTFLSLLDVYAWVQEDSGYVIGDRVPTG
jgi:hypothetical protein